MIVPSDKDYKETKLIKQGKASINPDFKSLAKWIDNNYKVNVLNIYYDITTGAYNKSFPRLNIIFENLEDEIKFRDGYLGNFHADKQKIIARKFDELVNGNKRTILLWSFIRTKTNKYDIQGLLVIFDAFKPIARDEVNEGIPEIEIDNLIAEINNPDIWKIIRFAAGATFFFYTDKQADNAKTTGYIQHLSDKYFDLLKKHDKFDYFDRKTYSISVDSKENFDKKYDGNWYYYFK
jgi:hypothetical protein